MMHKRRWCIGTVRSPEELAEKLTGRTWTLCTGFCVAGHEQYLFLNDATHEDGAGEYAALKGGMHGPWLQIESITFSWCSRQAALDHVRSILAGEYDNADYARPLTVHVEPPEKHGRCAFCA